MDKRIVVVGAGAIGGYTGGNLAHNGFDVTLIDPWPEHVEAIRKDGLALDGVTSDEFVLARPKMLHLTEVQHLAKERPIDIAFISVKSYDTEWAATMIRQYLAPTGYVVSLQNCINEERIAGIVGWGRTVGAIAAILSAELYAPGKIRRTGAKNPPGHEVYRVGEVHGRMTRRIEQALGYRLEDIAGQDADTLARASEGDRAALDEVESLMLALRNSQQRSEHQRPSMGQDMQKGRRTEIDFINGVIVEKGREIGRGAPTHEKLIAAVKRVELGHAAPSPEQIYGIA